MTKMNQNKLTISLAVEVRMKIKTVVFWSNVTWSNVCQH